MTNILNVYFKLQLIGRPTQFAYFFFDFVSILTCFGFNYLYNLTIVTITQSFAEDKESGAEEDTHEVEVKLGEVEEKRRRKVFCYIVSDG